MFLPSIIERIPIFAQKFVIVTKNY